MTEPLAMLPSPWTVLLLLLCGDVELNPGPSRNSENVAASAVPMTSTVPKSSSSAGKLPTSHSRLSMASIRSVIEKRRREQYIEPTPLWCSSRLTLALMGFWGFLNVYSMRVNLSVAMVCMINQTAIHAMSSSDATADVNASLTTYHVPNANASVFLNDTGLDVLTTGGVGGKNVSGFVDGGGSVGDGDADGVVVVDGCGDVDGNASLSREDGEFAWSKETQGLILGSFFWGYMTTQIAGGWLAGRFGGKRVYGLFMLGCAVCTLFMPLAARTDYRFLLALRFLAGVGQGVTFPAMNVLWANWAPPLESSKLGSIGYSGHVTTETHVLHMRVH